MPPGRAVVHSEDSRTPSAQQGGGRVQAGQARGGRLAQPGHDAYSTASRRTRDGPSSAGPAGPKVPSLGLSVDSPRPPGGGGVLTAQHRGAEPTPCALSALPWSLGIPCPSPGAGACPVVLSLCLVPCGPPQEPGRAHLSAEGSRAGAGASPESAQPPHLALPGQDRHTANSSSQPRGGHVALSPKP